jgi:hypothetical protein
MVEHLTSKSGAPTPTGGKSSSIRTNSSSIGRIRRLLMSKVEKMKRVIKCNCGLTMDPEHKNGKYSILTRLVKLLLRE